MAPNYWYSAKLLFVCEIIDDNIDNLDRLCEESIIIFEANSECDLQKTVEQIANSMQHNYENDEGQTVTWQFQGILQIQDLCEEKIDSGTEVYSRLFFESQVGFQTDSDEIRELIKRKR